MNDKKYDYLNKYLNQKSNYYLKIIYNEYGKYFNQNQLEIFKNLIESNNVVIESNDLEYKQNQGQEYISTPLAHGARVFNDNKIHFYPSIIQNQNEDNVKNECEQLLIHELLHYFIRPDYININNNDQLKKINYDITEALVDMCARNIHIKYKLFPNYNSNYANNVIFLREALQNISDNDQKMNLIFNGNIEQLIKTTTSDYSFINEYIKTINKETDFNKTISHISQRYMPEQSQSLERKLLNISANCKTKEQALNIINGMINNKRGEIVNIFEPLLEKYNDIPQDIVMQIMNNYINDARPIETIKNEINNFAEQLDISRQITGREIDPNILEKSILLIGPMGVGKTTISKDLSSILGMPRISLDNKEQLQQFYKDKDKFSDFKKFEFYLTSSILTSLKEPAIIDFGAGHSVYENPIMFHEMNKLISKFSNVELILPSQNKEESLQIINQRVQQRKGNISDHTIKINEHFIKDSSNERLATDVVYTKGKTIKEVENTIIDNVSSREKNNVNTNTMLTNTPKVRVLTKPSNNTVTKGESSGNKGYINTLILMLITGFTMGIISMLAYIFISR